MKLSVGILPVEEITAIMLAYCFIVSSEQPFLCFTWPQAEHLKLSDFFLLSILLFFSYSSFRLHVFQHLIMFRRPGNPVSVYLHTKNISIRRRL